MYFFKTIQPILSEGLASVCRGLRIDEENAIDETRSYLKKNTQAYYDEHCGVDYGNPLCRLAYLYCYVPAHANLIDNAFYKFDRLSEAFDMWVKENSYCYICALGGGPGSELLGIVKYFEREREKTDYIDIHFALIDKVKEWDETWNALVSGLEDTFRDEYGSNRREWPLLVHRSFLPCDLTEPSEFRNFVTRFERMNLYILNHVISEFFNKEGFVETLTQLAKTAPENALFLIVDRNQDAIIECAENAFNIPELTSFGIKKEKRNMDFDEQASDLGDWVDKMGRSPKLKWNVFYALWEKAA